MKATCASLLCASLVPLVVSFAWGDEIPDVGIGAVHPICDVTASECVSADRQVRDDLLAELEADEQITAVRKDIELGELLCDSLGDAPGSTLLRFAFSSTETVTAERTSFSVIGGGAFTDGQERKVWKGDVVDPVPTAEVPRTVSMTWASPCAVETFLLEMIDFNVDGTTSIKTSAPCDAGSSADICMVEFDIDLPNPTEPLLPPRSEEPPFLLEGTSHPEETGPGSQSSARRLQAGDEDNKSDRRLHSTTQIDVMFLYSSAALTRVLGGSTAEQMETKIVNELPRATEAAKNSEIDLEFKLVHAGPLPYEQAGLGSSSASSELGILRQNADVAALRNTHGADLVVLVGSFAGTCGLGYVLHDTKIADERLGFSLIDARCFNGKAVTHEMGHNLGCLHDIANVKVSTANDYSHGQRYCTGTGTRFHTIMAYYCKENAPSGYTGDYVPALNHFSNPDVSYLGVPTGTATANNARTVRENMDAVSKFRLRCEIDDDCMGTRTCFSGVCASSECAAIGGTLDYSGIGYCWPVL
ncbi:unnamed protein product [Scytosiphon promiscuus]